MPMFNTRCIECGYEAEMFAHRAESIEPCRKCGDQVAILQREGFGGASGVHGDELDYIAENLGRDPIHIRSKTQLFKIMKERGLRMTDRRNPIPGTDHDPHFVREGIDPQTLENARVLVSRQAEANKNAPPVDFIKTWDGRRVGLKVVRQYSGVIEIPQEKK